MNTSAQRKPRAKRAKPPRFAVNAWYEKLLAERETDRARFDAQYSFVTRLSVESYAKAKVLHLKD